MQGTYKRRENQKLKENSEYGKWLKENQRHIQVSFWSEVLSGHIAGKKEIILSEIQKDNGSIIVEIKKQYNTSPIGDYFN